MGVAKESACCKNTLAAELVQERSAVALLVRRMLKAGRFVFWPWASPALGARPQNRITLRQSPEILIKPMLNALGGQGGADHFSVNTTGITKNKGEVKDLIWVE